MTKNRIKIYLSGPITGVENFKEKFKDAENRTRKILKEHYNTVAVINPAEKPFNVVDGFDYEDCMTIDFACIEVCDAIVLIEGHEKSPGSKRELDFAQFMSKKVYRLRGNKLNENAPENSDYTNKSLFSRERYE